MIVAVTLALDCYEVLLARIHSKTLSIRISGESGQGRWGSFKDEGTKSSKRVNNCSTEAKIQSNVCRVIVSIDSSFGSKQHLENVHVDSIRDEEGEGSMQFEWMECQTEGVLFPVFERSTDPLATDPRLEVGCSREPQRAAEGLIPNPSKHDLKLSRMP